jgi:hypothetical protein
VRKLEDAMRPCAGVVDRTHKKMKSPQDIFPAEMWKAFAQGVNEREDRLIEVGGYQLFQQGRIFS